VCTDDGSNRWSQTAQIKNTGTGGSPTPTASTAASGIPLALSDSNGNYVANPKC
jgi:hypothetical protein